MPFISRGRLAQLEAAEQELKDFNDNDDKLETRLQRQHDRAVRSLEEQHEDEKDNMRRQHKGAVRKIEDNAQEKVEAADESVKTADRARKEAETERDAYKGLVSKQGDLTKREVELDTRETGLNAREKVLAARESAATDAETRIAKTLEKHAKEVVDAREDGYKTGEKKGYANGASDMVRTMKEQTQKADERVFNLAEKVITKEAPKAEINVMPVPTPTFANQNKQK